MAIFENYVISKNTKLPFFSKNEAGMEIRNFERHPLDNRQQYSVTEHYVTILLDEGHVPTVRGLPWAVLKTDQIGKSTYYLMSYATLTEAMYIAFAREPGNDNIVGSIRDGLENCIVLSADTPADVLSWLKVTHNAFHHGASTNPIELYPH